MIELSNSQAQTIQPGGYVTFDRVKLHTGCGECFNEQLPTSVKLCGRGGVYELHFSGNVTNTVAGDVVQMAMAIGPTPLTNTAMNAKPVAVGDLWAISTGTLYQNSCCDADRISIVNTGTTPVTLAPNSSFYVIRQS